MNKERYLQVERNGGDLTNEELAAGWHFCYGTNAGKLLNESDPQCACVEVLPEKHGYEMTDTEADTLGRGLRRSVKVLDND